MDTSEESINARQRCLTPMYGFNSEADTRGRERRV